MARFEQMKGVFGLLPTPYTEDYEINLPDLRAAADFCCQSRQHGIVWPVMVGQFHLLGEEERIRGLDAVMAEVNGRLPVVFGCSGISVPQVLTFGRAARQAGADAVIAMTPAQTDQRIAIEMYHRLAEAYDGPIMVQNADLYAPLNGEQIAKLVEDVPAIEYVKEERHPGPRHIAEVYELVGDKLKCIFGGAAGKFLPDELRRGANGCMPACELADILTKIQELWWDGQQEAARDLHRRLLPLIMRENHPFMRYILKRRGVFTNMIDRAAIGSAMLDEADKAEIDILLSAIEDDLNGFTFQPEISKTNE